MTGRTEERLRDATTTLGRSIGPRDIPALRLPEPGRGLAAGHMAWHAAGRWTGGRWLIPVASAASVLALVISLIVIGGTANQHRHGETGPGPLVLPNGMPAYLITDLGGQGYIRSTATGQVVARIRPPVPRFQIEGIAVAPGERTFYLAGEVLTAPGRAKVEIFKFTLDAHGRPSPPRRLGTPVMEQFPATSGIAGITMAMAVSPDGRELAYALPNWPGGGKARDVDVITVQNVATGARRSWTLQPASGAWVRSLSFAAGHRLGFVATIYWAAVSGGKVVARRHNGLIVFMILNMAASGSSLFADSRLVTYGSHYAPPQITFSPPLPGPYGGLITPNGRSAYLLLMSGPGTTRLVRISVSTGRVGEVLLSNMWQPNLADPSNGDPFTIDDGSQMLVMLPPRYSPAQGAHFMCGRLGGVNMSSGVISRLPVPLYCGGSSTTSPPPFEAAW